MEQTLKQRLVGAAVIIAIGVIVIPMILDGAGERQLRKMPDAPKAKSHSQPGMISEEPIPVSTTRETGQIVLTLPDDTIKAAAPVEEDKEPVQVAKESPREEVKPAPPEPTVSEKKPTSKPVEKPETAKPEKTVVKEAPAKPEADKKTTEVATPTSEKSQPTDVWVVQVGSFTDAKKAFSYRDKLISKKHKAFVEKISGRSGQNLYRVRIGPMPKREQAENMEAKLKQQGIKGFVTRHP